MDILKCEATGKTIYSTESEAREAMISLRLKWKTMFYLGKRVKRRQGKPALKRVYHCSYCDSYHLTKADRKYHSWEFDKIDFVPSYAFNHIVPIGL